MRMPGTFFGVYAFWWKQLECQPLGSAGWWRKFWPKRWASLHFCWLQRLEKGDGKTIRKKDRFLAFLFGSVYVDSATSKYKCFCLCQSVRKLGLQFVDWMFHAFQFHDIPCIPICWFWRRLTCCCQLYKWEADMIEAFQKHLEGKGPPGIGRRLWGSVGEAK